MDLFSVIIFLFIVILGIYIVFKIIKSYKEYESKPIDHTNIGEVVKLNGPEFPKSKTIKNTGCDYTFIIEPGINQNTYRPAASNNSGIFKIENILTIARDKNKNNLIISGKTLEKSVTVYNFPLSRHFSIGLVFHKDYLEVFYEGELIYTVNLKNEKIPETLTYSYGSGYNGTINVIYEPKSLTIDQIQEYSFIERDTGVIQNMLDTFSGIYLQQSRNSLDN